MQETGTIARRPWLRLVCATATLLAVAQANGAEVQTAAAVPEQAAAVQGVAEPQAPATFDLLELRVKGSTLLDKKQLERTVYHFLGPNKSIDNVEAARAAVEDLYRSNGYQTVAVDIPEQDVKNGVVYLQVVEGKVSRLRVKDSRYFSLGKIKAGVPELAEGNVPNFKAMQQQLTLLAGQSPDRQIVPVLRAGETPGTLEVDLNVKDELPFHGKVELNGRNTSSTSRLRLVSSLRYDNLWQEMHSASLMYQVSPENTAEVDVWAGTYAMPLFDSDSRLALYAVSSSSNAQIANAGALSVIGIGNIYGARLVKPLKPVADYFHTATLGMDYKDFQEDLNLLSADSIKTPISYLPFLAQYSGSLRGAESFTSFDLGLHVSFRGLGNNQKEFENKRYLAKANYMFLTGDLKYQHDLPLGMELYSHVAAQVADTPLISNEQFSLGGDESVRGYFETQALADDAVFGSVELRSPHLGPSDWEFLNKFKLLGFLDVGRGWIKNALPGNVRSNFLSGGGFGLRFQMWRKLSGALDVGIPLTTLAPVQSGDPRVHFNIAAEF
ncbi:ShlB/FhaC/HecB family hemolysin secretion/activation protein [Methylomonas koyamae]|uniref:ShlB/FhaC/HecB family hemolysin secretion/activation protein n=1 Tax=Methylomonas koyamae TaxID=702114 RepID=UPI002872F6CA|nr:ShlB/FhaC/HecB family hemolysin secretion/activation protein [Methylomonas koyamae]WNB77862.1 ShlB/FhaC/HecB family hemolysin secretion/activation protein [Methylomonas koyamae]